MLHSAFPGAAQSRFTESSSSDVEIRPYVCIDGSWTVEDAELAELFNECRSDGLKDLVFFDGSIDTELQFIEAAKSPNNLTVVFIDGYSAVGFAWLNAIGARSAFAHFCFLKRGWGRKALDVGHRTVDYWMAFKKQDGSPLLQVILGTIPTINQRALKYVFRLGFELCGSIPKMIEGRDGKLYAADLVYYERR